MQVQFNTPKKTVIAFVSLVETLRPIRGSKFSGYDHTEGGDRIVILGGPTNENQTPKPTNQPATQHLTFCVCRTGIQISRRKKRIVRGLLWWVKGVVLSHSFNSLPPRTDAPCRTPVRIVLRYNEVGRNGHEQIFTASRKFYGFGLIRKPRKRDFRVLVGEVLLVIGIILFFFLRFRGSRRPRTSSTLTTPRKSQRLR